MLRSPSGRSVDLRLPTGHGLYAAVTPRVELDAALVDLATAAGVKVHQGHGITAIADDGQTVTVDVDGIGPITAGHVIAADGMWSPTRKLLGLHEDGYLGEWHAIRQYVSGVTGPAKDRLIVWFDADFLPGYAWSFPLPDGRANVGFGILRNDGRPTKEMKAVWAAFFDRPHVAAALGPAATPEGRHLAWPIPARVDKAHLAHDRVLFVGDAAAATDLMTGEGIGQALLTGRLAAEAIVGGSSGQSGDAAARYVRDSPPRARGRSPHVGAPRPCAQAPQGRSGRSLDRRALGRVGSTQLRPLDVRGRAPSDPGDAPPLASPVLQASRRLRRDRPDADLTDCARHYP